MRYNFRDLIIARITPKGNAKAEDPLPTEEFTFRYGEITWEHTPTDPTGGGKVKAVITAGWSTFHNEPT